MKNEKGVSAVELLLVIILIFACVFAFKIMSNNKNNIVGYWNVATIGSLNSEYNSIYIFDKDGTGCVRSYGIIL